MNVYMYNMHTKNPKATAAFITWSHAPGCLDCLCPLSRYYKVSSGAQAIGTRSQCPTIKYWVWTAEVKPLTMK